MPPDAALDVGRDLKVDERLLALDVDMLDALLASCVQEVLEGVGLRARGNADDEQPLRAAPALVGGEPPAAGPRGILQSPRRAPLSNWSR